MQKPIPVALAILAALLLLPGFRLTEDAPPAAIKYPKKVNAVLQAKCYDCHSNAGYIEEVRAALNWDTLDELPREEQLDKMRNIQRVLIERSMPPADFLEHEPERALNDKEYARLEKWAGKTVRRLGR